MIQELLLPTAVMMALGWLVPQWLRPLFPEGVRPLIRLGVVAAVILLGVSVVAFVGAYLVQSVPIGLLFDPVLAGVWHFLRLGLLSALLWLPVMLLSVAQIPGKWVEEEW